MDLKREIKAICIGASALLAVQAPVSSLAANTANNNREVSNVIVHLGDFVNHFTPLSKGINFTENDEAMNLFRMDLGFTASAQESTALSSNSSIVRLSSVNTSKNVINDKNLEDSIRKMLKSDGYNIKPSQPLTKKYLDKIITLNLYGKEDLSELYKLTNLGGLNVISGKSLDLDKINKIPYRLNNFKFFNSSPRILDAFSKYYMYSLEFDDSVISSPKKFFDQLTKLKEQNYDCIDGGLVEVIGNSKAEELLQTVKINFKKDLDKKAVALALKKSINSDIDFSDTYWSMGIKLDKEIFNQLKLSQNEKDDLVVRLLNTQLGVCTIAIDDDSVNIPKLIEEGKINKNNVNGIAISDTQLGGEYRYELGKIFELKDYSIQMKRESIKEYQIAEARRLGMIEEITDAAKENMNSEYPEKLYAARLANIIADYNMQIDESDLKAFIDGGFISKKESKNETKKIKEAAIKNVINYMVKSGIEAKEKDGEVVFDFDGNKGKCNPLNGDFEIEGISEEDSANAYYDIMDAAEKELDNFYIKGSYYNLLSKLHDEESNYFTPVPSRIPDKPRPTLKVMNEYWNKKIEEPDWWFKVD